MQSQPCTQIAENPRLRDQTAWEKLEGNDAVAVVTGRRPRWFGWSLLLQWKSYTK